MAAICPLFYLPQNGGHRKCQTPLARSLSAGQFSGDWGMPTNKQSPFCTKGHCLPVYNFDNNIYVKVGKAVRLLS